VNHGGLLNEKLGRKCGNSQDVDQRHRCPTGDDGYKGPGCRPRTSAQEVWQEPSGGVFFARKRRGDPLLAIVVTLRASPLADSAVCHCRAWPTVRREGASASRLSPLLPHAHSLHMCPLGIKIRLRPVTSAG